MAELRKDPIVDRWVIISPGRSDRPNDFQQAPSIRAGGPCPFCEGHEDCSPPEIWALRAAGTLPGQPGWRVRVVPNKYPALQRHPPKLEHISGGIALPGFGVHEVIIESPRHLTSNLQFTTPEVAEVLAAYRARLQALRLEPRIRCGLVFKNVGPAAGASLEHAHSQLIGLPVVPNDLADELAAALTFFQERGECVFCRLLADELARGGRIVLELDDFVALCPFAPRFPFETWLLPKAHASHFEQIAEEKLLQLAQLMQQAITRIQRQIGQAAYNYIIHTSPFDTSALGHYHWHIEIIPRVTNLAGFEWGTGYYINPVSPEEAAAALRLADAAGA